MRRWKGFGSSSIFGALAPIKRSRGRLIRFSRVPGTKWHRPLYVYLPPGYFENPWKRYPVLYMHDGQNCFEAFVEDSHNGSWKADLTSDRLIAEEQIEPCIIVGVSHGGKHRMIEYLPPYLSLAPDSKALTAGQRRRATKPIPGRADITFARYRDIVAPFIESQFRIRTDRSHTATCGSSMGGLFTTYIALEHPEFARRHAALSPSFRIAKNSSGTPTMVSRIKQLAPQEIRLWLDSGTRDDMGPGDDGMAETIAVKEALVAQGYQQGENLFHSIDEGAGHNESAWASRFEQVLRFLSPTEGGEEPVYSIPSPVSVGSVA